MCARAVFCWFQDDVEVGRGGAAAAGDGSQVLGDAEAHRRVAGYADGVSTRGMADATCACAMVVGCQSSVAVTVVCFVFIAPFVVVAWSRRCSPFDSK